MGVCALRPQSETATAAVNSEAEVVHRQDTSDRLPPRLRFAPLADHARVINAFIVLYCIVRYDWCVSIITYYVLFVFTARCYASEVLAIGLCLSVCVRLSQVGVLLKRQNVGSHKNTARYLRDSSFLMPKISAKFDRSHPLRGRRMQVGWVKIGDF